MKILVVAATLPEIQASCSFLEQQQVDYLITGVGMVATAYQLGKHLAAHTYDLIINVGIAGILNSAHPLTRVYRVLSDEIFQFGAEDKERFIPIEQLGFGNSSYKEKSIDRLEALLSEIPTAMGITVNKVHGNSAHIAELREQRDSNTLESMEGVAVFYAANQENTPCYQFRASSNYIAPRDRERWEIAGAIAQINRFLQGFIGEIQKH